MGNNSVPRVYAWQLTSVVNRLTKVSAIATAFTFTKGSYTFNFQFQLTLWPNVGVGATERVLLACLIWAILEDW